MIGRPGWSALLVWLVAPALLAIEVPLCSPLTTLIEAGEVPAGDKILAVELSIPTDAPADLGLGAYACDRDGRWFRSPRAAGIGPGRHRLEFPFTSVDRLVAEPGRDAWNPLRAAVSGRAGIYLWSASGSRARITVHALQTRSATPAVPAGVRLSDLRLDGAGPGGVLGRCGERWSLEFSVQPAPANPYDPDLFSADLLVQPPGAAPEQRIPCFWHEPMRLADGGDREEAGPDGPGRFAARFRPCQPGLHRLRLEISLPGAPRRVLALPPLQVAGQACDPWVRVDDDHRFFSVDGRWYWPIGLNINSTYDRRCAEVNRTILTPARGTLVYEAMFPRLAAAGGDAVEIWMSSWNLGLEWRREWPGYLGIGRYNQANAARLDRVLDLAWAQGIRVNLTLNNHGQASARNDREWKDNPWSRLAGGPLEAAIDLFDDPRSLAGQERLRRYIIGRYADHPAVLGWKLWSEINLTAAKGEVVVAWHEQAAARWKELDPYDHPVTSHWSGDYKVVNPLVAELPGLDYICIDAYRGAKRSGGEWRPLAEILAESTQMAGRGLGRYRKPVLTTEFGASSGQAPESCREIDHRIGFWCGLVSGHGGSPMNWWWEWVDQGGRWAPFGAIRRFLAGEDLRGAEARSVELLCLPSEGRLWCRAWARPGRILGYLLERRWGAMGGAAPRIEGALVEVGGAVAGGLVHVAWWDADRGQVVAEREVLHPGGLLRLPVPAFDGHLAFKVWRGQ